MKDRELLELAAKAAGISPVLCYETARNCLRIGNRQSYALWRPLTDDGDALRLAANLGVSLIFLFSNLEGGYKRGVVARHMHIEAEEWGNDIADCTRRAIVRAAAEIGKDKK
jgi:hypothetical protein